MQNEVPLDTTILAAAEPVSTALRYECRSGICGHCKVRLIEGKVSGEHFMKTFLFVLLPLTVF